MHLAGKVVRVICGHVGGLRQRLWHLVGWAVCRGWALEQLTRFFANSQPDALVTKGSRHECRFCHSGEVLGVEDFERTRGRLGKSLYLTLQSFVEDEFEAKFALSFAR